MKDNRFHIQSALNKATQQDGQTVLALAMELCLLDEAQDLRWDSLPIKHRKVYLKQAENAYFSLKLKGLLAEKEEEALQGDELLESQAAEASLLNKGFIDQKFIAEFKEKHKPTDFHERLLTFIKDLKPAIVAGKEAHALVQESWHIHAALHSDLYSNIPEVYEFLTRRLDKLRSYNLEEAGRRKAVQSVMDWILKEYPPTV